MTQYAEMMADFVACANEAHVRARHVHPWEVCPHPICRELERWVHDRLQDGPTPVDTGGGRP